jgi:hypothetical protein
MFLKVSHLAPVSVALQGTKPDAPDAYRQSTRETRGKTAPQLFTLKHTKNGSWCAARFLIGSAAFLDQVAAFLDQQRALDPGIFALRTLHTLLYAQ